MSRLIINESMKCFSASLSKCNYGAHKWPFAGRKTTGTQSRKSEQLKQYIFAGVGDLMQITN